MNKIFEDYIEYSAGIRNFSKASTASYTADLKIFNSWLKDMELEVFAVSVSDMRIFIAELGDKKFAPSSINRMLSTLRGFYKYAVKFKLTEENPMLSFSNLKLPQKLPNFLFSDEAENFCALPEKKGLLWEARDTALFSSLYSTGCRVAELAGLNVCDLSYDLSSAIVFGKGKKERQVFFADFAQKYLRRYLDERAGFLKDKQMPQDADGRAALFLNKKGGRLSVRGIQYIIDRYTEISSLPKTLSPHAFRHSFASTLVTRGADIRVVQELLGHESISTTQRYTHITASQLQQLYNKAHPHS